MHTDTTPERHHVLLMPNPGNETSEHPNKASGMDPDVLRAAKRVLENYAASLERHATPTTDAGSRS